MESIAAGCVSERLILTEDVQSLQVLNIHLFKSSFTPGAISITDINAFTIVFT